jgi:hypothetical protein
MKSEKEWKRFRLSLIPSNRCFVPFTVQIYLLPVVFVAKNLVRSTISDGSDGSDNSDGLDK